MAHIVSNKVSQNRVAAWIAESEKFRIDGRTWTETRQAIVFNGHTYLIAKGQVFQCAHCGHYDPDWVAHEVLDYFRDTFGIKPVEVEITCSISV